MWVDSDRQDIVVEGGGVLGFGVGRGRVQGLVQELVVFFSGGVFFSFMYMVLGICYMFYFILLRYFILFKLGQDDKNKYNYFLERVI